MAMVSGSPGLTPVAGRLAALLVCVAFTACDLSGTPPSGSQSSVSGLVTYQGPRPNCRGEEVLGQIVFQLLRRPSLEVVAETRRPATRLFIGAADCPVDPSPVTREYEFELDGFGPVETLFEATDFFLVAFYDANDDYVLDDAFLGQPDRGDVFGAAYASLERRTFLPISFGPSGAFLQGQKVVDVAVQIDARVWSEVPAFRFASGLKALSSEQVFPPAATFGEPEWEDALIEPASMSLEILPGQTDPHRSALETVGIVLEDEPQRGFWSDDPDPLRQSGELRHPVFGDDGITWRTPFVTLTRMRTPAEVAAGVPDVLLYPLVRPSLEAKRVFSPTAELLVPPVAFIDLNPDLPVCQVRLLAPGNEAPAYETGSIDCQELPTGSYQTEVRHGVAGGIASSGVPPNISDTGLRVESGEFVAQRWSIPNDLGQLLNDQGMGATFRVVDPNPATSADPLAGSVDHGIEACREGIDPGMETPRPINLMPVPPACCEPVRHLCGIELCEAVGPEDAGVRAATTVDGRTPNCVPFAIPASCCQ